MESVKVDTSELVSLRERIAELGSKQLPFAKALALTRTAQASQAAIRQDMSRVFDRPTPFTLSSVRFQFVDKNAVSPAVEVYLSDEASKSIPIATALRHEVVGGERYWKRSEGALRRIGLLGNDENAVPGSAATLDSYGNMSRSQIVEILSWFQAFAESGYRGNATEKTKAKKIRGTKSTAGSRYFFKRDGPGRGIYLSQRAFGGWSMRPVLMFVRRGRYSSRLDMRGTIERVVREQFPAWFRDALDEAKRTAR